MCAGYEDGEWRCSQLARHVIEWLPEFALPPEKHDEVNIGNAVDQLRRAAQVIYTTDKYGLRGEFGEIILHAIIRQEYDTIPAISKVFVKTASNDTVKGFDAVHVVDTGSDLELWLGEAKFYDEIGGAIREVVKELHDHFATSYLRREFIFIGNKVSDAWPHADRLRRLLDENVSIDEVFAHVRVPVLLTYDSDVIGAHDAVGAEFLSGFNEEMRKHHARFVKAAPPERVKISLILLPLKEKAKLVEALHRRLKALQEL